jgi:acyl dehydratase
MDLPFTIEGPDGLREMVGRTVGPTEWRTVTQADIDAFAELSGDHQWIHTEPERAATESPYGATIAHGNLTLSMIDGFRLALMSIQGVKLGINYGWNRVRFPAPVIAGTNVRATAELVSVDDLGEGWMQSVTRFTVEAEGQAKPACVADSVGRILAD